MSGYVLLEDGTRLDGELFGAGGAGEAGEGGVAPGATGEVVFNTAMSGYQESVTDPSYRGQIIVFTYPHIGNYGVSRAAMESDAVHARAVIMREGVDREDAPHAEAGWLSWLRDCGVPALTGVDTRALVRHIRDKGAMRGGLFAADVPERDALDRVRSEPPLEDPEAFAEAQQEAAAEAPDRGQAAGEAEGEEPEDATGEPSEAAAVPPPEPAE